MFVVSAPTYVCMYVYVCVCVCVCVCVGGGGGLVGGGVGR